MNLSINPKDYEFIYAGKGWSFFVMSFWTVPKERKYKFIHIVTNYDEIKTYLKISEKNIMGEIGLKFYNSHEYSDYIEKFRRLKVESDHYFQTIYDLDYKNLSNLDLSKKFIELVEYVSRIWEFYSITKVFWEEKIEEMIMNKLEGYAVLEKKANHIAEIKLELRKILNFTLYSKQSGYLFESFFRVLKDRFGVDNPHMHTYLEIYDIFNSKVVPIPDRKTHVWSYINEYNPLLNSDADLVRNYFQEDDSKNVMTVEGKIANPGYAIGRVRILRKDTTINLFEEAKKLLKGEILIADSTVPDLMLACENSAAIVTNEGGICCHAAIVSRELNKPCIIATKNATSVFKDGDMVEVDANTGVVKLFH